MKLKNILNSILLSTLLLNSVSADITINKINLTEEESIVEETNINNNSPKITRSYTFIFLSELVWNVPNSYKYIDLKYKDIKEDSALWQALQKLVYLDKIKNTESLVRKNQIIDKYEFYLLSNLVLWLDISIDRDLQKDQILTIDDLEYVKSIYLKTTNTPDTKTILWSKEELFNDVYNTLRNWHYNKEEISKEDLIYWAIEWLANWTWDKHTVYFPPVESKDFEDSLSWEYQWIWAYVEMTEPGVVKITSPIPGWPAEKAWIKWWDIIVKVDWVQVTQENSLQEVVSWIKWPKWTTVNLTILRNTKTIELEVTRDKIVIHNLDHEKLSSNTYYIKMKSFWNGISWEFKEAIDTIKTNKSIKKIIIDLRNNWGWYLWEVTEMLSYVVPEWENTAIVKYNGANKAYVSKWYDFIDLNKYEIIILQNSWTASASEILIWTLDDYFDIVKIWENTYWKGSVQTLKYYNDWSSLKYTIAKWFTWKSETGIDWIWIKPDIELELDIEKYNKNWTDNQLNKAIYY